MSDYLDGAPRPPSGGATGALSPAPASNVPSPIVGGRNYNFVAELANATTGITWLDGAQFIQVAYNTWTNNRSLPSNDISTLGLDLTDIDLFRSEAWVGSGSDIPIGIPGIPAGTYDAVYYSSDASATEPVGQRTVDLDFGQGQVVNQSVAVTIGGNGAIASVARGVVVPDEGGGLGTFWLTVSPVSDNANIVALSLIPDTISQISSDLNFFDPFTSTDSGRVWVSGERTIGGTVQRYTVPGGSEPANPMGDVGLQDDEIELFKAYNWIDQVAGDGDLVLTNVTTVPEGLYTAEVLLSESLASAAGQRVFEYVDINGVRAMQGVDLYARAGRDAQRFIVDFSVGAAGTVSVTARCTAGNPFINALRVYPRAAGQASKIIRNCGVDGAGQPFSFTDSNGVIWGADEEWEVTNEVRTIWDVDPVPTNLEEFGFTAADNPLVSAVRWSFHPGIASATRYLDYNLTIEGGFRYQVGLLTVEKYNGVRPIEVLWNGAQVIAPITPPANNEILLTFGWLDLTALSGPQAGVLRFQTQDNGEDFNPLVAGFYVLEQTTEPPGTPSRLLFNLGGEVPRDFTTVAGDVWNEDTPFLDASVDEAERLTIPGAINGLPEENLEQTDQGLVQDVRFSTAVPIKHMFRLEAGVKWCLKLYLVEPTGSGNGPGGRLMDVYAQGVQIAADLDPYALAGNQYDTLATHACGFVDLTASTEDFVDVTVEVREASGSNGPQPYPLVAAFEWQLVELSMIREVVKDDQGNIRADATGLYVFVWEALQLDPPIVGQLITSSTSGITDSSGYLQLNLPSSIIPGTTVVVGLSSAQSPDDNTVWSFFGPVVTRSQNP